MPIEMAIVAQSEMRTRQMPHVKLLSHCAGPQSGSDGDGGARGGGGGLGGEGGGGGKGGIKSQNPIG